MKKDQAPTRVVPVEAGDQARGKVGPQVRVLLKEGRWQPRSYQVLMCQAGPHSVCSAEGHDLNSNLLSSTKNNCAENAVLYFFIYFVSCQ